MNQRPVKSILRVLDGEPVWPLPVWIMRQAGRYLPEYRETRKQAGSFLDLCYTPRLAEEVTLQPIRRFGFDAAIMFSDILVIPHALGQDVRFVENEGPKLDPVTSESDLARLSDEMPIERLAPVFETLDRLRSSLPPETTLLGFCGAPWTVASYMIAGKGTPDQAPARLTAYRDPAFMQKLDRQAGGGLDRLSDPPDRCGRGGDADLRELSGRRCRRPCSIVSRSNRSAASSRARRLPGRTRG